MPGTKHVAWIAVLMVFAAAVPAMGQASTSPAPTPSAATPTPTPELVPTDGNVRPSAGAPAAAPTGVQDPNLLSRDPNQVVPISWYQNPMNLFMVVVVGLLVVMLFFNSRTRRKTEAKRNQMLTAMKKGDRVTTIGGVIGTLIEVRDRDVVVKIDEQNNTRVRFLRSAIHSVGEQPADPKEQAKS